VITAATEPFLGAIIRYGIGETGPIQPSEPLLKINRVTEFECQSCSWPGPTRSGKMFEFCENGTKAAADG